MQRIETVVWRVNWIALPADRDVPLIIQTLQEGCELRREHSKIMRNSRSDASSTHEPFVVMEVDQIYPLNPCRDGVSRSQQRV